MTGNLKTTAIAKSRLFSNLSPRERWTPSEWSENCRVLTDKESSDAGPYRFDVTPYWRFVCDQAAAPGIEEIIVVKGAQIGWSELTQNIMGYWIDLDPGPILVLAPDQKSAENFRDERIQPLIEGTDAIRRHLTSKKWDATKHRIKFDTCSLFLAWAGSSSGVKSRPIRRLICEEPDEYKNFSGEGGDPLSKAEKRLTTYRRTGRSTMLLGGTPTSRRKNVSKRWELCSVRYHYFVPCPKCNGYQRLLWKQVKWPDLGEVARAKRAEKVKFENLAYYECEHCKHQIHNHDKPRMLRRGKWASEDQVVTIDGRIVGPSPKAKRIGFMVSGLYSPWVSFSELASEWIECQGDPDALADFINQRLAEVFEQQRAKIEPTVIAEKARGGPPAMLIPAWARWVVVTADTQGNDERDGYFWYVIRAWGLGEKSRLLDFGICRSFDELRQRSFERQIPIEGGGAAAASLLVIDSGGPRWNEVYTFSLSDQRIHPSKGSANQRTWMVEEKPQKATKVILWLIDTDQSKDMLHRLIHDPDRMKWMPHRDVIDGKKEFAEAAESSDYCRQMASEAKIYDKHLGREIWVEIVKNNNHLWDCEAQQCAAATRLGCGRPEPEPEPEPVPTGPAPEPWLSSYQGRH